MQVLFVMSSILNKLALSCLRMLPAEYSHSLFISFAKNFSPLLPSLKIIPKETKFFSHIIKNPCGVAAGLDKNADIIPALFKMGFGFVEIGTVTPKPQIGNQKPRIFRIKGSKSMLNFMGFPNKGCDYALQNVKNFKREQNQILGVNIGRNKDGTDEDYTFLIGKFYKYCDFITINISSPNTPNLRDSLNNLEKLQNLLSLIDNFRKKNVITTPVLLKISPDVTNLQEIYKTSCTYNIDGFILTNTTSDKSLFPKRFQNLQMGGISGTLLKEKSHALLQEFNKINVNKKFVISCGGISSNNDIESRLNNGADVVQIYTGLVYGAFL